MRSLVHRAQSRDERGCVEALVGPERAKRMLGRHALFQVDVGKQRCRGEAEELSDPRIEAPVLPATSQNHICPSLSAAESFDSLIIVRMRRYRCHDNDRFEPKPR